MTVASAIASFALVAGLLTIIPGLDTAMVLRSAVSGGRRHGFATALGIATGSLLWGIAAAVGASALLTASRVAYDALRLAGALYLLWMGFGLLRASFRRQPDMTASSQAPATTTGSLPRSWARGLTTNLLNPKIGVFYVAMLPQFIPPGAPHLLMGIALATVHDIEGMAWFTALILGTHLTGRWLRSTRAHRLIDRLTGTVLIAFGLKLALAEN
jgi:threonine/homoserine/homoserine lactone efflux protein